MIVRDLHGRPVFYLDDGDESARDVNGKPVARAVKGPLRTLAARASRALGGKTVLMDLGPGDVATPATELELGIPDGDFVADVVSPVHMVKHDRGVWYPENATDAIKPVVPIASGAGNPAMVNPSWTPANFVTIGYALAAKIPRLTMANADFNLKRRATRMIVNALKLAREIRVATQLTTAASFAAGNQVAAIAKWNGGATANPLTDTFAALAASYLPATAIVLSEKLAPLYFANANSTSVRDFVQAGGALPRPVVARAKMLSGGSPVYVWSPAAAANVPVIRTTGDVDTLPTAATLRWVGQGPDGDVVDGVLVREFDDSVEDCHWIVVVHNDAEIVPSNQVGAIITGATA